MRKHDVRKWLHAVLDLLPVILIPVFMIYSHRHDISSVSSYTEQVPVYYDTNEVTNVNDIIIGNAYTWQDNVTASSPTNDIGAYITIDKTTHDLFFPTYANDYDNASWTIGLSSYGVNMRLYVGSSWDENLVINSRSFIFVVNSINDVNVLNSILGGLAPCTNYFKEYQSITYDFDKDIMGAFMNNFNFTINKYFNMGNVFNLNGVYQWFNTNIFSGNAPTVIYSIWNIALYELVMDLLFLLYGLFMWFIDMVEHLMEKPFKSIK